MDEVAFDVFRPHWRHNRCGGIVAAFGDEEYRCQRCGETARAIGAVIPADTLKHDEYFFTHPELEVTLLDNEQAAAAQKRVRSFRTDENSGRSARLP